ncbi:MAG: ATP-binding protein [Anaerolineae bacterium]|nr:tRNA 2-thiocytidine(32) synthetase TtcA [Anaerolineae bacterium]MDW8101699.1 ATP-binding protein [Anaerolineae bacterium]
MKWPRESLLNSPEIRKRAYFLLKKVNRAIRQHRLIEDGDRIAVAVSGGKDSLVLLHLLHWRRFFSPQRYEMVAINIQNDYGFGVPKEVLEGIFQREGIPYVFEYVNLKEGARPGEDPLNCFWCSWNRRKALFIAAHRLGYPKVAFAHHADDVAATFLLNLFFHSKPEGLKPKVSMFGGLITIIRPLFYLEEREIISFARQAGLMVEQNRCPRASETQRARMNELIRSLEKEIPHLKANLIKVSERCNYEEDRL